MPSIVIHEHTNAAGALVRTELSLEDDALVLASEGQARPLPPGALDAVMRRYGKPLAPETLQAPGFALEASLDLGGGRTLGRFRFRPRYDVIARDYLALFSPGEEPLCELATAVTAALNHLSRSLEMRGACQR
jgi:hypothetical protein